MYAKCMKVVPADYSFMASRGNLHWFCSKCDSLAMEGTLDDKDLKEKVNKHIEVVFIKFLKSIGR